MEDLGGDYAHCLHFGYFYFYYAVVKYKYICCIVGIEGSVFLKNILKSDHTRKHKKEKNFDDSK